MPILSTSKPAELSYWDIENVETLKTLGGITNHFLRPQICHEIGSARSHTWHHGKYCAIAFHQAITTVKMLPRSRWLISWGYTSLSNLPCNYFHVLSELSITPLLLSGKANFMKRLVAKLYRWTLTLPIRKRVLYFNYKFIMNPRSCDQFSITLTLHSEDSKFGLYSLAKLLVLVNFISLVLRVLYFEYILVILYA